MSGFGVLIILAAVPVLAVLLLVAMRNRIVRMKYQITNAFGSVDAMLKKRHDLIPNLVAAVQAYMAHEKGLLQRVTELRAEALRSGLATGERLKLEADLSRALSGVMVAVENYPHLKADRNVLQLQAALNETEEQISAARRFYNTAVTDYNTALEVFPSNLAASLFGYRPTTVFQAGEAERETPRVGQLFGG